MELLELIKIAIYGIVEGITEWLPISSTGHLILLEKILPLNLSEGFLSAFRVIIQLGAILAVLVLYWKKLLPFSLKSEGKKGSSLSWKQDAFVLWGKILVACVPAAVIGLAFDDWIEAHLYTPLVVALALIIVGILFIVVEDSHKGRVARYEGVNDIPWKLAFYIGIFQVLAAVFPGVSRSGATILGALLLGVSRSAATEFTFYLAIPVMFGASFLKLIKLDYAPSGTEWLVLLLASALALIVSLLSIRFLTNYVKKNNFKPFAYYRIALGLLVLVFFFLL